MSAHTAHLRAPEYADATCYHCETNLEDPRNRRDQPCDDDGSICMACCAANESPCDDCAAHLDEQRTSYGITYEAGAS